MADKYLDKRAKSWYNDNVNVDVSVGANVYRFHSTTGLEQAGLRGKVKAIVGGVPLPVAYAQPIGADGFAQDASRAVMLAKSLVAWWTVFLLILV